MFKMFNAKLYRATIEHLAQMKNLQEEDLRNERRAWDKLIEAGEKSPHEMPERARAVELPEAGEPADVNQNEPPGGQADGTNGVGNQVPEKTPEELAAEAAAAEAERLAAEEAAKRSEAAKKAAATRAAKKTAKS